MNFYLKLLRIISLILTSYSLATARADILDQGIPSPFLLKPSGLKELNVTLAARAEAELNKLKDIEVLLEKRKIELDPHNEGALQLVQSLKSEFSKLPKNTQDTFLNGEIDLATIPDDQLKTLIAIQDKADGAKMLAGDFINDLDLYIQKSLDYSIFLTLQMASEHVERLNENSNFSKKERNNLEKLYLKMREAVYGENGFISNKDEYGQAKDSFRISPYNRFFDLSEKFFEISAPVVEANNQQDRGTPTKSLTKLKLSALKKIPVAFGMIWDAAKILGAAVFKIQPTGQRTLLMNSVNSAIRKISKVQGLDVTVVGAENIPMTYEKGTVTLFTPSHRDAFKDMVAIAHLGVDSAIPFAAAGSFIPSEIKIPFTKTKINLSKLKSFLIGRLNKNYGIIVVGNKDNPNPIDPVEKAIQILQMTDIRSFLIYPEGRLPDAQGAAGPMREKMFSELGPIERFEALGFKVNLVPVTMSLNYLPNGESKNIEVKVYPTIDDYTRRVITRFGGSSGLAMLYRYGLVSDLVTNTDLLWGQLRASRMQQEFRKRFNIEANPATKSEKVFTAQCVRFYN